MKTLGTQTRNSEAILTSTIQKMEEIVSGIKDRMIKEMGTLVKRKC